MSRLFQSSNRCLKGGSPRILTLGRALRRGQILGFRALILICISGSILAAAEVDFGRHIEPILRVACQRCHGPAKQSGGLRLDGAAAVRDGGISGPAIVPGDAAASLLYQKITGTAAGSRMPLEGPELAPWQIERLRLWIDEGAEWPDATRAQATIETRTDHWAYLSPQPKHPPAVEAKAWLRNPIDAFVLARLEKTGLQPSPQAPKETLIRRLSLDLIGLPPTLAEIDDFLRDQSSDAYEKVVERLLDSPHYGERWARHWLDLARYADTRGYEKDRSRSMWLYRDWVIRALNQDMPFDRFTIEQQAGDLLPEATPDQRIATGFHRNSMVNEEGGTDAEEFRVASVRDRVNTTATVWLGTTLECAQCHDHKHDPFTQKEYFQFFAFFNNSKEEVDQQARSERVAFPPNLTTTAPRYLDERRRTLEDRIADAERELAAVRSQLPSRQKAWETELAAKQIDWEPLDALSITSVAGAEPAALGDGSVLVSGPRPANDTYLLEFATSLDGIRAIRLEALPHPSLPSAGPGRGDKGRFVLTSIELEIEPLKGTSGRRRIQFDEVGADYSEPGFHVNNAIREDPLRGWAAAAGHDSFQSGHQAVFATDEPFGFEGGTRLKFRLRHDSDHSGALLGKFRLSASASAEALSSVEIPKRVAEILAKPSSTRDSEDRQLLRQFHALTAPEVEPPTARLRRLRDIWDELTSPSTYVLEELQQPRSTHLHRGGSFLSPGEQVEPRTPAVLHTFDDDRRDRLGLARWLVSSDNPLVARVTVNRIWAEHFGRGLVETEEDFGTLGEVPSHPDLLDWLALEFSRDWSLKSLHRLIVTSATYRQSSRVDPELQRRDPHNRLLARGPRFRMDAEMIRDNALAVAGLLDEQMYGPSVFPPQPEGVWNLVYNSEKWVESDGGDLYRRGIYTFWRRTAPYPAFMTFDAPSRETTCTRRVRTNTPLQALTTLNDPVFVEAARGLAARMLEKAGERATGEAIERGLIHGFRVTLTRHPTSRELDRLRALFSEQLEIYRHDLEGARRLAGKRLLKTDGTDAAAVAAWIVAANVLLNLDETITRG